jgi:DNA replication protein DnaD
MTILIHEPKCTRTSALIGRIRLRLTLILLLLLLSSVDVQSDRKYELKNTKITKTISNTSTTTKNLLNKNPPIVDAIGL